MEEYSILLPLYPDPDYNYFVSLERVSYKLRFYYNERMQQWIMSMYYSDGTPIVLGEAVVDQYPIFLDYAIEPSGYFWLEPIGKDQNHTIAHPYEIHQYYNLYYRYTA